MGFAGKGLDEEGARRVVEEHYDDVLAYCRRHAPTYDDALDATQETFLRFVRSLPGYRDRGKPLAFLLTVARGVCADAYRRRGRTWEQLDENAAADEPQGGGVREALFSLPPEQREDPRAALRPRPARQRGRPRARREQVRGGAEDLCRARGAQGRA